MKKSIWTLVFLAAAFTQNQASAVVASADLSERDPDGMSQVLACVNPSLRDAGVRVTVSYGGIAPHYSADVSEISIAGSKVILTVSQVTTSMEGARQVFTDLETQGEKFRLVYNPVHGNEDTSDTLNATLVMRGDSSITTSELNCESVDHPSFASKFLQSSN